MHRLLAPLVFVTRPGRCCVGRTGAFMGPLACSLLVACAEATSTGSKATPAVPDDVPADPDVATVREAIAMVHQEAMLRDARLLVESAGKRRPEHDRVEIKVERAACVVWDTLPGDVLGANAWREAPAQAYPNDPPEEDLTGGRTERVCFMVHMKNVSEAEVMDACGDRFRAVDATGLVMSTYPLSDLEDQLDGGVALSPGQSCRGTFGFRYRPTEQPMTLEFRDPKLLASDVMSFEIRALRPTSVANSLGLAVPDWAPPATASTASGPNPTKETSP